MGFKHWLIAFLAVLGSAAWVVLFLYLKWAVMAFIAGAAFLASVFAMFAIGEVAGSTRGSFWDGTPYD